MRWQSFPYFAAVTKMQAISINIFTFCFCFIHVKDLSAPNDVFDVTLDEPMWLPRSFPVFLDSNGMTINKRKRFVYDR
jgi:hypothetical protein